MAERSNDAMRIRREAMEIEGFTPFASTPPGVNCFISPPPGSFYWGGNWYAPSRSASPRPNDDNAE